METTESQIKFGLSLRFFGNAERETMKKCVDSGIRYAELSFSRDYYFNTMRLPERCAEFKKNASETGLTLWSIHLPFTRVLDISSEDEVAREEILAINSRLLRAAAEAGVRVAVLHPSSEPISDERRPYRMEHSRASVIRLKRVAEDSGITLAVENLPRDCLCSTSAEMVELIGGIDGIKVNFDTNHSLREDNLDFIKTLYAGGLSIASVHASDYNLTTESHRLPGNGLIDWKKLLGGLFAHGYRGPLIYELYQQSLDGAEKYTFESVVESMKKIGAEYGGV